MAADVERTGNLGRVFGGPERQRGHLQRRDPPFTSSVQQRELTGGDPDTEILEQGAALGQREVQVAVTELAELTGQRSTRSVMVLAAAPAAWKSSTTITDPAGSLAASFAIEAVTSADITPSIASSSAASAPNPGATA